MVINRTPASFILGPLGFFFLNAMQSVLVLQVRKAQPQNVVTVPSGSSWDTTEYEEGSRSRRLRTCNPMGCGCCQEVGVVRGHTSSFTFTCSLMIHLNVFYVQCEVGMKVFAPRQCLTPPPLSTETPRVAGVPCCK